MKKLSKAIDRFCIAHPRFGVPNLILFIIIGNVIVFLFSQMDNSGMFSYYLMFNPQQILKGEVWRLFTFVIVPESNKILYLFISLYFYYFIGSTLERQWGTAKFTLYYLSGMLITIIYGMICWFLFHTSFMIGASYINLSMFFVFAALFPESRVLLFFIIPVKIKWLALIDAALFLYDIIIYLISGAYIAAFLPIAAVLNFFIFCFDIISGLIKQVKRPRSKASNVIDFKKAAKKAVSEIEGKSYTRKCAVCGRTDTDYPDLEFRYCSRCEGYHCFCTDHIYSHIHFTE